MRKIMFVQMMMAAIPGCRISHAAFAWATVFEDATETDGPDNKLIIAAHVARGITEYAQKHPKGT